MRGQAGLKEKLFLEYEELQPLRYGENPHQKAKFYKALKPLPYSLATARQLNGKELSYNNIQDANAALNIVREFSGPFAVGLKHTNPCGAAQAPTIEEAWAKAYEGDKTSIFGGIVAFNRELTLALAQALKPVFLEVILAPSFAPEALELLRSKKNLRLLEVDMSSPQSSGLQFASVNGGLLAQEQDLQTKELDASMAATRLRPTPEQLEDLNFAWKIVKHLKSNAIAVVSGKMLYGAGAGQMNRVGSAKLALEQAAATFAQQDGGLPKEASARRAPVLASDGFFPFDDCVQLAAEYGVKAIAQPGGSVKDADSVSKADECGIAMLMTGERHFKH